MRVVYAPWFICAFAALMWIGCQSETKDPKTTAPKATPTTTAPPAPKTPPPPPKPTYVIQPKGKDGRNMVQVPEGPFLRGSTPDVGKDEERPQKTITLTGFWIDETEVTVADYKKCIAGGACKKGTFRSYKPKPNAKKPEPCNHGVPDRGDHPINCVSWHGAKAYCGWVGKRLPTEAEWEKAARGTDGRTYPWGEDEPNCTRACMVQRSNFGCGERTSCKVGTRKQGISPYGALDMAGNVYEWVDDMYTKDWYSKAPDQNPKNTSKTTFRPVRGGAYSSDKVGIRATQRSAFEAKERISFVGFRCAMNK